MNMLYLFCTRLISKLQFHYMHTHTPTVKLPAEPHQLQMLEPPHMSTSPGPPQPHFGGGDSALKPQAQPISSLLPQKDIACCLQETNAFHFLPALLSGKTSSAQAADG